MTDMLDIGAPLRKGAKSRTIPKPIGYDDWSVHDRGWYLLYAGMAEIEPEDMIDAEDAAITVAFSRAAKSHMTAIETKYKEAGR